MCGGVHVSVRRRGTPALLPHRERTLDGARAPSHPAATQRRRNERRRGSDREACSAQRPLPLRPPPPRRGGLAVAPRDGTARRGAAPGAAPGSDAEPSPKRHLQGVPHTVRRATRERGPHGGPRAGALVPHAEAASEPPHAAECRLPHTSSGGTPPPQRAPPPPSRPGQAVAQLACLLQRRCRARPHAPLLQRAAYRLRRRGEGSANQAKGWASAEQKRPSNPPGPRLPNPYVVCRVYARGGICAHLCAPAARRRGQTPTRARARCRASASGARRAARRGDRREAVRSGPSPCCTRVLERYATRRAGSESPSLGKGWGSGRASYHPLALGPRPLPPPT